MKPRWAILPFVACALIGAAAIFGTGIQPRHCDTRNVPIGATRDEVLKICGPASTEWDRGGRYYKLGDAVSPAAPVVHWMAWRGISNDDVVTLKGDRVDYTSSD